MTIGLLEGHTNIKLPLNGSNEGITSVLLVTLALKDTQI